MSAFAPCDATGDEAPVAKTPTETDAEAVAIVGVVFSEASGSGAEPSRVRKRSRFAAVGVAERKSKRRLNLLTCGRPAVLRDLLPGPQGVRVVIGGEEVLGAFCLTVLQEGNVPPLVPTTVTRQRG